MAFIFSTGAVIRMMAAQKDDPLVTWIEDEGVRPFIAPTTMALLRYELRLPDRIPPAQLAVFEKRYNRLARDLRAERSEQVSSAIFDQKSAEILSDILMIDAGRETLSDMDLVPAAIAIQHNLELVITDTIPDWQALADAIAPELGRLALKIYPPEAA